MDQGNKLPLPMLQRLVLTIYELGRDDALGEVSREDCQRRLGIDLPTFGHFLEQANDMGYLRSHGGVIGSVRLSARGLRVARGLVGRS